MIDLEEEFRLLMEAAIKTIDDKENAGDFNSYEAQRLRDMVERQQQEEADRCPQGHTGDCGWSASMGYHCS
jgi:hypothetical protein